MKGISLESAPCGNEAPHGAHTYNPAGRPAWDKYTCRGYKQPERPKPRQVVRHWWPDDKPDPWVKCMGRKNEGLVQVTQPGYPNGPVYEHITTRNRMAVNCEACTSCLPEVVAARRDAAVRGCEVVAGLAQYGISASYENRHGPVVEMHLIEAAKLLEALDAAYQRGVHAGQESAG